MARHYYFNRWNLGLGPHEFQALAEKAHSDRFPKLHNRPGYRYLIPYWAAYLVIDDDHHLRIDFVFPEDGQLRLEVHHKRPGGCRPGEQIRNIDIREVTMVHIPRWQDRYYFDFVFAILDPTTNGHWMTNLWTGRICPDRRYYRSRQRRCQYEEVGRKLADRFTRTFVLGYVSLRRARLHTSPTIRRLINHGWLPTLSILPQPFGEMVRVLNSSRDVAKVDEVAKSQFDSGLLSEMLDRWSRARLPKSRMHVFQKAVEYYLRGDYVTPVYLLLPQIEGLITDYVRANRHQAKPKLADRFRQFGEIVKAQSHCTDFCRHLVGLLVSNLSGAFYRRYFPTGSSRRIPSSAPQRHVLLHGAQTPKQFLPTNTLKLASTIDAIVLLSLSKVELRGAKH